MIRRMLNRKLVALLACATVVLAVGVHVLHGFQVRRGARGLLALALRMESEGHPDKSAEYLRRYLALRPDDVDALARLADMIEQQDDSPQGRAAALGVYRKALRLTGARSDIRRRLVDLAVKSEDFTEALPHVELLLHDEPKSGELNFLLGRCQEAAGRVKEAVESYNKARALEPARIDAYTRLADLLRQRRHDADGADRVMDARSEKDGVVARNARSAAAYLARARYRTRYRVPGVDAAADVRRALELAPDDPDALLAAAESARAQGRLDEARTHLEHGLKRDPELIAFYRALADVELKAGHADAAVKWLKAGFERPARGSVEAQATIGWSLADTLVNLGRTDEAEAVIKQLEDRRVRPELLDYLRALVDATRARWAAAVTRWEQLLPTLAAQPALNGLTKRALVSLGHCFERLGNVDQSYDAYRRAVAIDLENDSFWVEARLGLAAALVDLNRLDEAIEQYRIVLPRQPGIGVTMARLQVMRNLRRPAEEQRWDEIERTLAAVERGVAGAPGEARVEAGVSILRAESLAAQGQLSPARRLLERALEKYPKDADLWVALANLAGREGKPDDTVKVLDEARHRLGERIELMLARAAYWASQGGNEAAGALAEIEREAETLPAGERTRLRRELAAAYARIGRDAQADALWTKLADEQPDDLNLRLVLFDRAIRADDAPAAKRALAQIKGIEGDGPLGHYGEAVLLFRNAQRDKNNPALLTRALSELQRAAVRRPLWSLVARAQGDVEALAGRTDAAIQAYLRAILQLGERDARAVAQVLRLLSTRGRLAEAAQVVQKLNDERVPLSGDLQRLVAQVSYQNGDPGRALKLAQASIAADSKDPDELLWLAQIQWAAGQPAEATLRRAVALSGDSPKTWLALILYLAGTGQNEQAAEALGKAEKAIPADSAALALAQANEALGRREAAANLYKQALDANPDDLPTLRAVAAFYLRSGRRTDAEAMLDRIIQLGGTTTDAAWARRVLATVMGLGGDYRRSQKALVILGLSDETETANSLAPAEDVRTKARILAVQPNRARRREAIGLLEGLVTRRQATPDDLFLLAQLDEADGQWPKARTRLLELAGGHTPSPIALTVLIRALLRHDAADEAAAYLNRLESLAKGAPVVTELKALVLAAHGKTADAVALLNQDAKTDDARARAAAQLLEELKQPQAAEALLRALVAADKPDRPAGTVALALFLGRHGRTREALDLVDRVWAKLPLETASHACVLILMGNLGDAASPERVAQRLEQETKSHSENIELQFDLANVRLFQDRSADAEAIYRAVYERDKTGSGPLNNLAWLLAMRGKDSADEALKLIDLAVERAGETPNLLDTRAVAHMAKGEPDRAIRDLEDAITVQPTAKQYLHLARAYQMKGRRDDSAQAVRKAKDLGLKASDLHPLERPTYGALLSAGR